MGSEASGAGERDLRVRRAGFGHAASGEAITWSVATGHRGRRWRESAGDGGALRHSLLLETSPEGRFLHLELSTPAGLLTLHPEHDGTLHGNAVQRDGLQHVKGLPWERDGLVIIAASPLSLAAAAYLLTRSGPRTDDGRHRRLALRISPELALIAGAEEAERLGEGRWRLGGDVLSADVNGLPLLTGGRSWPLEAAE
jgi:hypothetical protein